MPPHPHRPDDHLPRDLGRRSWSARSPRSPGRPARPRSSSSSSTARCPPPLDEALADAAARAHPDVRVERLARQRRQRARLGPRPRARDRRLRGPARLRRRLAPPPAGAPDGGRRGARARPRRARRCSSSRAPRTTSSACARPRRATGIVRRAAPEQPDQQPDRRVPPASSRSTSGATPTCATCRTTTSSHGCSPAAPGPRTSPSRSCCSTPGRDDRPARRLADGAQRLDVQRRLRDTGTFGNVLLARNMVVRSAFRVIPPRLLSASTRVFRRNRSRDHRQRRRPTG